MKYGVQNDETAYENVQSDEAPARFEAPSMDEVPTYLAQSILVTLFCCVPLGIPAIIYAAQVTSKLQSGDVAGALRASQNAKKLCWLGCIAAIIIWVFLMAID